ncbi:MAG: trehalose-phosphatase [Syntrophobacterales bacterium GWC2_56_13]|nr:MAG: trehalose-phosphatase [Syntrophobacterales bacterium GWC2_56_13]
MAARHLLDSWEELKTDLADRSLYLFLDYDGTLSPIVRDSGKAVLSLRMRGRLEALSKAGRCRIAVISGRSLEDIRRRVGIAGFAYGGNHGLEVEGPEGKFRYPVPEKAMRALDDVRRTVERELSPVPGVFLEDKGLSLTVHFRRVKRGELLIAAHAVSEATRLYRMRGEIVVRPGKEAFEIRPSVTWDKGKTVQWLLEKSTIAGGEPPWPLYVGDDRTDEDAFREIRERGATVFVGAPRQTEARYYLRNVGEVAEFLGRLVRI